MCDVVGIMSVCNQNVCRDIVNVNVFVTSFMTYWVEFNEQLFSKTNFIALNGCLPRTAVAGTDQGVSAVFLWAEIGPLQEKSRISELMTTDLLFCR